ncbi:MAG: bifunctional proline dehydrogenase/L-glutamate gamma-semialdehyde dehydrogenase PutA [Gammaproteobacteria bacterium]|jgi:RHH-type proline utilization regulon transcriptional repressor/proline dehydrogenase/delta 1-pyrroline-5-carboxylate dehydrogenase|nr:bifunctional proline dehydrogenase/L-glutamate gamma-semialdehyde dehydrogenase PutA [Gammaproteobacteria bacterium]
MLITQQTPARRSPIAEVNARYLIDEQALVNELRKIADPGETVRGRIHDTATELVAAVRRNKAREGGIDAFLQQYDLSSEEGVLLMCIAEALLRIPDADTADRLIADKITAARWEEHLGTSESLFVNASTWGLMLTGQLLKIDETVRINPAQLLAKVASRAGEPVVRTAMRQAMRIMGHQFVMGRNIKEALQRSVSKRNKSYRYSFDMLGEAALTAADARRYFEAYYSAIGEIGAAPRTAGDDIFSAPSISVKLSALHPRYEYTQVDRVLRELAPRVLELAEHAKQSDIAMTIDAEEADRLELSLQVFKRVFRDGGLTGYDGLGLAVQTYQRRASDVFGFLEGLARDVGRRIPVRLVKGAYWDTEIKHAQELGLDSYPVFTRKVHTDVSYLACACKALEAGEALYPQFATHNAHTLASVMHYAGSRLNYEFQRLHGMGEELYAEVIDPEKFARPCRVYAPVGSHKDLLPYLVRRLLENGANTSFVNRIIDDSIDIADIVADPITATEAHAGEPHPHIPSPRLLFGKERRNSQGLNLADDKVTADLLTAMQDASASSRAAHPIVAGKAMSGEFVDSLNPADNGHTVGTCQVATAGHVDAAIASACAAQPEWDRTPASGRAEILEVAADLYEQHRPELLSLCIDEAGKTLPDAEAELREAVDFLRFYAAQARKQFGDPAELPGPTGERNTLGMRGRGVFVCISPWNFPLAIFTGQVAAALAAGNSVLAKPAEQTPLVAFRAVELLMEAGVPGQVLQFLPGDGATVGGRAVADPRIAGVAFTGSTGTARLINRALAGRDGPIGTLIAETGGLNAMFVDSSALPEQVVKDAAFSAFNSAGQRCSALRLLCLQTDIADRVIELLVGHMEELVIGNPALLATDVGPAIDDEARSMLEAHVKQMENEARVLYRCPLDDGTESGTFFAPTLIEIDSVDALENEVFGPVLHVLKFRSRDLQATIDAVNASGYGLTMGLHSRIDARARRLAELSGAGNIYINRNMIGAVVGVQPFGGRGLSGTGPKAGGPHYLPRFGTEYTISNNIAAVGGNASLLSLEND